MIKKPNSRVNLDKAINRFAGNARSADAMRNSLANVIVAQMLPEAYRAAMREYPDQGSNAQNYRERTKANVRGVVGGIRWRT